MPPIITCCKKKEVVYIAVWKPACFSQEKKVPYTAQQKAIFPLETHTELTMEKKQISVQKDRLLIHSSSSSSLQPSACSLSIRNFSTGFLSF